MDRIGKIKNADVSDMSRKLHRWNGHQNRNTKELDALQRRQASSFSGKASTGWTRDTLHLPPIDPNNTSLVSRDEARGVFIDTNISSSMECNHNRIQCDVDVNSSNTFLRGRKYFKVPHDTSYGKHIPTKEGSSYNARLYGLGSICPGEYVSYPLHGNHISTHVSTPYKARLSGLGSICPDENLPYPSLGNHISTHESTTYINGALIGSSIGTKLKSGNVRFKHILPPIGETYQLRAEQYDTDVVEHVTWPQKRPPEDPCEVFLEIPIGKKAEWLGDFVENMRQYFCMQDEHLAAFLISEVSTRRDATCDALDRYNEHVGNAERVRHQLISDIIATYF